MKITSLNLSDDAKTMENADSISKDRRGEAGFTLLEVACALVIILVALLGVVFSFTYVVNYNAGNNARAQTLAVLQQRVEMLRAAKFTRTGAPDPALNGGTHALIPVTNPSGGQFNVLVVVDNDPFTDGIQDETTQGTLKEITVTVTLASPSPGWQTAIPATAVLRRTRGN